MGTVTDGPPHEGYWNGGRLARKRLRKGCGQDFSILCSSVRPRGLGKGLPGPELRRVPLVTYVPERAPR